MDISNFAKGIDLAILKSYAGKLDIEKLEASPIDFSKLNNVAKNAVAKNAVYDEFLYDEYDEVNAIQTGDTTDLFLKSCLQHKNRRNRKKKFLTMINILLIHNLINQRKKILLKN